MESELIKNIIKIRNIIHKKYQALKTGKAEEEIKLESVFKPIKHPLKKIVDKINYPHIKSKVKEEEEWKTLFKSKHLKTEFSSTPHEYSNKLEDNFITPQTNKQPDFFQKSFDESFDESHQLQQPAFSNSLNRFFKEMNLKEGDIDYKYGPHLDSNV